MGLFSLVGVRFCESFVHFRRDLNPCFLQQFQSFLPGRKARIELDKFHRIAQEAEFDPFKLCFVTGTETFQLPKVPDYAAQVPQSAVPCPTGRRLMSAFAHE